MANPSNLYAEKIFSEHPLALWALDQTVDYISLFDLDYQDIQEFWTVSGATASLETSDVDAPFSTVEVNKLLGTVPTGATADIVCISPELVNFSDLNTDLGTFCVGAHVYVDSPYINSISIGFEYTDTTTSQIVQNLKTFQTSIFQQWGFVSETFQIPDEI